MDIHEKSCVHTHVFFVSDCLDWHTQQRPIINYIPPKNLGCFIGCQGLGAGDKNAKVSEGVLMDF